MDWPNGRSEALRRMWLDGSTSGQIASALGVTRNAVLGRIRRMGLMGRREGAIAPRAAAEPRKTPPARQMQRLPHESHLWALSESKRRDAFARRAARAAQQALEAVVL
jgi:GcrA cell cycle regulator